MEIRELQQRMRIIENKMWYIENPPKFKVGDRVLYYDTFDQSEDEFIVTERGEYNNENSRHWYYSIYNDAKKISYGAQEPTLHPVS